MVTFAPGGITGLLMMHWPLIKGGTFGRVLPSYLMGLIPTLAMLAGLVLAIETVVHYTVNPGDDPNIKAFGMNFNVSSPTTWIVAFLLIVVGFVTARKTWSRLALAWDDALKAAREKGYHT